MRPEEGWLAVVMAGTVRDVVVLGSRLVVEAALAGAAEELSLPEDRVLGLRVRFAEVGELEGGLLRLAGVVFLKESLVGFAGVSALAAAGGEEAGDDSIGDWLENGSDVDARGFLVGLLGFLGLVTPFFFFFDGVLALEFFEVGGMSSSSGMILMDFAAAFMKLSKGSLLPASPLRKSDNAWGRSVSVLEGLGSLVALAGVDPDVLSCGLLAAEEDGIVVAEEGALLMAKDRLLYLG